uniref:Uncharacterized protein n=1 Tax=Cacopsylla melanoneura TaxID=428564 RepID=A0A8D8XGV7_9HEMI
MDTHKVTALNTSTEKVNMTKVFHHIPTHGPPCYACPRQLPPDKLKAAKQEFQFMLQKGIIRPSKSPWASPLHMVPKKVILVPFVKSAKDTTNSPKTHFSRNMGVSFEIVMCILRCWCSHLISAGLQKTCCMT